MMNMISDESMKRIMELELKGMPMDSSIKEVWCIKAIEEDRTARGAPATPLILPIRKTFPNALKNQSDDGDCDINIYVLDTPHIPKINNLIVPSGEQYQFLRNYRRCEYQLFLLNDFSLIRSIHRPFPKSEINWIYNYTYFICAHTNAMHESNRIPSINESVTKLYLNEKSFHAFSRNDSDENLESGRIAKGEGQVICGNEIRAQHAIKTIEDFLAEDKDIFRGST